MINKLQVLNSPKITAVLLAVLAMVLLTGCMGGEQSEFVKKVVNPYKYSDNTWHKNIPGSNVYETDNTIEIYDGLGGFENDWRELAAYAVRSDKTVMIRGNCISACTVMAEEVFNRHGSQCVSSRAYFSFHKARTDAGAWVDIEHYYRPEVVRAVKEFPEGYEYTTLNPEVARELFETNCNRKM